MSLDLMLELAWKSGLIAGAALVGASLLRGRPAVERVAVLRLGAVMLLTLPLLVMLMPALRVETPAFAAPAPLTARAVPTDAAPLPAPAPVAAALAPPIQATSTPPAAARPEWRIDPVVAPLVLWAAGFSFLTLRLLAGVILLHRWTRRAEPVTDIRWLAALARAARGRTPPILRASPRVISPLSWGWRPAIILLDPASLDQAGRADAVLAHEMGHVRHGDWLFLMASRLLVALFWFNPLVWVLQRELARQSEQAADAWAAGRIGRADYASALVAMAARGRPHAALGMAAPKGELARRVIAILNASTAGGKPWRAALAITACVGMATPLAAVELSPAVTPSALPSVVRSATVAPRASSPALAAAAIAAAMAPTSASPGVPPAPTAQLATVLRQRDQGLAMMEAGARIMEARALEMRVIAAGLAPDDRAALNADADDLVREAAELRAEARELAARDPSTLRPMTPDDERELAEGLRQTVSIDGRPPIIAEGPVTITADALTVPAPTPMSLTLATGVELEMDNSGAWRTANGVQVDASGALRTSSGVHMNASGEVLAPNGARIDPAGDVRAPDGAEAAAAREQMRVGAQQLRDGARQIEAGAEMAERSAPAGDAARRAESRARADEMRAQAANLRRQADVMEPDG
jgi:beta-lactamase regulating signal transducer with metallopeptidase domain